jgi:hypothetical protein
LSQREAWIRVSDKSETATVACDRKCAETGADRLAPAVQIVVAGGMTMRKPKVKKTLRELDRKTLAVVAGGWAYPCSYTPPPPSGGLAGGISEAMN